MASATGGARRRSRILAFQVLFETDVSGKELDVSGKELAATLERQLDRKSVV